MAKFSDYQPEVNAIKEDTFNFFSTIYPRKKLTTYDAYSKVIATLKVKLLKFAKSKGFQPTVAEADEEARTFVVEKLKKIKD